MGRCTEFDAKIEHYDQIAGSITDQLTIERIKKLVERMAAEGLRFIQSKGREGPYWRCNAAFRYVQLACGRFCRYRQNRCRLPDLGNSLTIGLTSSHSWLKAYGRLFLNFHQEMQPHLKATETFPSERTRKFARMKLAEPQMSARARSILISPNARSPQRRCMNGLKNWVKAIECSCR